MHALTVYNVRDGRTPVVVRARSVQGLKRKLERQINRGCVLEPANVAEAHELVVGLGLWPTAWRLPTPPAPEDVSARSGEAWARQEDRMAARDKLRAERPYLP